MSSNSYGTKTIQEIEPVIDNYIYKNQKNDLNDLIKRMKELKEEKEQALFIATFGHLNPINLADCVKLLEDKLNVNNKMQKTHNDNGFHLGKSKK
jgi:hypothetical protein